MIYLDDAFFTHSKVTAVGDDAAILYLKGLGWLKQHRSTDGRIPLHVIPRIAPIIRDRPLPTDPLRDRLVAVALWESEQGHVVCHGYVEFNQKAIHKSEQARNAARKRHALAAERASEQSADAVRTHSERSSERSSDAHATVHSPQSTVHIEQSTTPRESPASAEDALPAVVETSEHLPAAQALCRQLAASLEGRGERVPHHGTANGWVREMEAMLRLDGRDPDAASRIIRWLDAGSDGTASFWRANVRSPAKLRAKWTQMGEQYLDQRKPRAGSADAGRDALRDLIESGTL